MVDQHSQSDAGGAGPAGGTDLALLAVAAEAIREVATAIGDLAGAIRETASFATEFEFVPCAEVGDTEDASDDTGQSTEDNRGDNGDDREAADGERTAHGSTTVLPLVPAQRRGEAGQRPLCRPGGCGCGQPDTGQGRHARRDNSDSDAAADDAGVGTEVAAR